MQHQPPTLAKQIQALIDAARIDRSCISCDWFYEKGEVCTLNGLNQRPPARVIATGCPCWQEAPPF